MKSLFAKKKITTIAGYTFLALSLSACEPNSAQSSSSEVTASKAATGPAQTESAQTNTVESESVKANAFFERVFEESVARQPESLTFLGRKDRADEWNDLSQAFSDQSLVLDKQYLKELGHIDRAQLDSATQLSYDLFKQNLEESIEDARWRLYNYPVNQMFGRHTGVVSLLINQHRINAVSYTHLTLPTIYSV